MNRKVLRKKIIGLTVLGLMVFNTGLMAQSNVAVNQNEIIEECLNDGLFTKQFSESIFNNIQSYVVVNNSALTIPSGFEVDGKSVVVAEVNNVTTDTYFTLESVNIVGDRATVLYDFHYSLNGVSKTQAVEAELGVFNGHWSTMNSNLMN